MLENPLKAQYLIHSKCFDTLDHRVHGSAEPMVAEPANLTLVDENISTECQFGLGLLRAVRILEEVRAWSTGIRFIP